MEETTTISGMIFGLLFSKVGAVIIIGLIGLFTGMFTVSEKEVAVIERLGKYHRTASAGLGIKVPLIDTIKDLVDLKIQQLTFLIEVQVEKAFFKIPISVQYQVLPDKVYEAVYQLEDHEAQIEAYARNVVRTEAPSLTIDGLFKSKDQISDAVKKELLADMQKFGYEIVAVLMGDIQPEESVKVAMNGVYAAEQRRAAAALNAEGEKITRVKAAEADAEAMKLEGEGIANQRKAIVDGMKASVEELKGALPGADAQSVMTLLLTTQYFDAMEKVANGDATTIFMPHSPGAVTDVMMQIRAAMTGIGKPSAAAATNAS